MVFFEKLKTWPNHIYLLIGIILFVFVFPILDNASILDIFGPLSYTIILLSGLSVIEKKKSKKLKWLSILVIISTIIIWINYFRGRDVYKFVSFVFSISVLISVSVIMISEIIKSKEIDKKLILESICGYLLIGVMFTLTNTLIQSLLPNSFILSSEEEISDLIYYSFVSLTTIGYGDIIPQTDIAKIASVFFGLCGQLYLTIIIALIIGKYLNRENK